MIMIFGYAIIAVPTGIIINDLRDKKQKCTNCHYTKNSIENNYCGNCGKKYSFLKFIPFVLCILFLLHYTSDIKIVNSEKLFLSDQGIKKLSEFEDEFTQQEFLIYEDSKDIFKEVAQLTCQDDCHIIDKKTTRLMANNKDSDLRILVSSNQEKLKKVVGKILLDKPEFNMAGASFINHLLDANSKIIGQVIFPLFFLMIAVFIYVIFRSINLVVITMIPTILSALISQSLIKIFFKTSDIIIAITPLLVSILVFTTIIHVIFQFTQTNCFKKAIHLKLRPIVYMTTSTIFGFSSLNFSPLSIISTFGILSALHLAIGIVFALLFLYFIPTLSWSNKKRYQT